MNPKACKDPSEVLPAPLIEHDDLHQIREKDLVRAAQHHQRALLALKSSGFERLPIPLMDKLIIHFRHQFWLIEEELRRRGLDVEEIRTPFR